MSANQLLYGDNLDILRRHVADETVDLVYLDPPFKSNQDYNVLFAERDGTRAAAQIKAFKDTWRWDDAAARAYEEVVESGDRVADALRAFRMCIGRNDMLAYLSDDGPSPLGAEARPEADWKPLSALRSDVESLPEGAA